MGAHAVQLHGDPAQARGFYRALGLEELLGTLVLLQHRPEGPGAVLVWPGATGVFYDFEGNLHRQEPPPKPPSSPSGWPRPLGVLYGVRDLVDSIGWYQETLGLELVHYDASSDWAELSDGEGLGVLLTFAADDNRKGVLVLEVSDAALWVAERGRRGVSPVWTRSTGWGRLAAYADPFGNPLLFIDRSGSGSDP